MPTNETKPPQIEDWEALQPQLIPFKIPPHNEHGSKIQMVRIDPDSKANKMRRILTDCISNDITFEELTATLIFTQKSNAPLETLFACSNKFNQLTDTVRAATSSFERLSNVIKQIENIEDVQ